jgi:hypothetical protein
MHGAASNGETTENGLVERSSDRAAKLERVGGAGVSKSA